MSFKVNMAYNPFVAAGVIVNEVVHKQPWSESVVHVKTEVGI